MRKLEDRLQNIVTDKEEIHKIVEPKYLNLIHIKSNQIIYITLQTLKKNSPLRIMFKPKT